MALAHTRGVGDETPVSLGYDRIRFLAPVFLGDTVTVDYTFDRIDPERRRSVARTESYCLSVSCGFWESPSSFP